MQELVEMREKQEENRMDTAIKEDLRAKVSEIALTGQSSMRAIAMRSFRSWTTKSKESVLMKLFVAHDSLYLNMTALVSQRASENELLQALLCNKADLSAKIIEAEKVTEESTMANHRQSFYG